MTMRMEDKGYEQVAHLYDLFDNKDNIGFFCHYARQVGTILDIGAGTGRIAIPLARSGVNVVCLEPSPAMRRQFEKKLAAHPDLAKRITLRSGDAASFELGCIFPAAFLSGCFDHLITAGERHAALANIARHLWPGGLLVFDVFLGAMKDSPLTLVDQVTIGCREYRRYIGTRISPKHYLEITLVFEVHENDQCRERIEQHSQAGITDHAEISALLHRTGFAINREFSGYNFAPYQEGAALLIIETRRKHNAEKGEADCAREQLL